MVFVTIPGGEYTLGGKSDVKPLHKVKIKPFKLGKYEVTQREWRRVMGKNPAEFGLATTTLWRV